ncbi:hypothetical protein ACWFMI_00605 [Nocardiopsis terrae]
MDNLQARLLGGADDLGSTFYDTATQFTDQDISTSPRLTISTEEEGQIRETRLILLEHVTNSQNASIDQPPPQDQIDVLVEHGVAEKQSGGSYVFELDRTK